MIKLTSKQKKEYRIKGEEYKRLASETKIKINGLENQINGLESQVGQLKRDLELTMPKVSGSKGFCTKCGVKSLIFDRARNNYDIYKCAICGDEDKDYFMI